MDIKDLKKELSKKMEDDAITNGGFTTQQAKWLIAKIHSIYRDLD